MEIDLTGKKVAVSRTDSIGDVILTLPVCTWLKQQFPNVKITFICSNYTAEIVKCFSYVDEIIIWDDWKSKNLNKQKELLIKREFYAFFHVFPNKNIAKLAKSAKIPYRIGTSHRIFHLSTCNILAHFTRKKSEFHEAQLNFNLFKKFGIKKLPSLDKLATYLDEFKPKVELTPFLKKVLNTDRRKVILHPKSKGSAVEWPMSKYIELSKLLVEKNYIVYFTGTEKEGLLFRKELPENENIIDISGKCNLGELITFISKCDILIACSTGPLHIAAALKIKTIGLYTDVRPIHPGRWCPLGENAIVITKSSDKPQPEDVLKIEVLDVVQNII